MYALLGKFTATAGNKQALAERLIEGTRLIKSVQGLRQYLIYTGDGESVWVSEMWDSQDDHDASLQVPGIREFISDTMPMIAGMDAYPVALIGGIGKPPG